MHVKTILQGTKNRVDFCYRATKTESVFMVVTKTKLIFVEYKNRVNFCKQVTKTKSIFSKLATKTELILASSSLNQVGF